MNVQNRRPGWTSFDYKLAIYDHVRSNRNRLRSEVYANKNHSDV